MTEVIVASRRPKIRVEHAPKFNIEGDVFVARVDSPGVRPSAVSVGVEDNVIVVTTGDVTHRISAPSRLDLEEAKAEYVFGQLVVTLVPKAPLKFAVTVDVAAA